MKLTMTERLLLANQYRILEKLHPGKAPGEAKYFAELREILEQGFENLYFRLFESIDPNTVSETAGSEVLSVLAMFEALKDSYEALPDKTGIDANDVQFAGFSGNNEGGLLSFARFFCESDGGKHKSFISGQVPNSHFPMMRTYRRMLAVFEARPQGEIPYASLSKETILKLVAARKSE